MKSTLRRRSFSVLILCTTIYMSCKETSKFPGLSYQLYDSIYVWEKSTLNHADHYNSYLIATSRDTSIHTEKVLQNTYYPWKVNLNKQQVDSFLVYLDKNLATEKNYKSAFGELPSIRAEYIPLDKHYVIADLLTCKLVKYALTNSKGEKIIIDENEVSINKNTGSINFSLAKWDLQGQKIKGQVTLEIVIPYHIYKIELKPGDKSRTFDFGTTKITVLELENNILHYALQDDEDYSTNVLIDSCMSSTHRLSFPEYFYQKLRTKPNLSYQQFVADSAYFELGTKWKKDPKRVRVVYFESCNPGTIYVYGYQRAEVSKKLITVPMEAEIK